MRLRIPIYTLQRGMWELQTGKHTAALHTRLVFVSEAHALS
jgi:hypothetical protein